MPFQKIAGDQNHATQDHKNRDSYKRVVQGLSLCQAVAQKLRDDIDDVAENIRRSRPSQSGYGASRQDGNKPAAIFRDQGDDGPDIAQFVIHNANAPWAISPWRDCVYSRIIRQLEPT